MEPHLSVLRSSHQKCSQPCGYSRTVATVFHLWCFFLRLLHRGSGKETSHVGPSFSFCVSNLPSDCSAFYQEEFKWQILLPRLKQGRGNEWMRRGIFLDVPGVTAAIQSTKKKSVCVRQIFLLLGHQQMMVSSNRFPLTRHKSRSDGPSSPWGKT